MKKLTAIIVVVSSALLGGCDDAHNSTPHGLNGCERPLVVIANNANGLILRDAKGDVPPDNEEACNPTFRKLVEVQVHSNLTYYAEVTGLQPNTVGVEVLTNRGRLDAWRTYTENKRLNTLHKFDSTRSKH